jgi:hypothetical protein
VIHGYMETWVPGYLLDRRDRFASRAHLVHLRPFSNGSATSPRPGFRKLFLPPTLGQHRYRQSQPVRSIRSQGRLATRELVHSHKAHSRYCHQHQTLTDQRGEPGGTSADHPSISIFPKAHTESCPLPLSYSTALQHLRIRVPALVCSIQPTLETHHGQSAAPSYCLHHLSNQSPKSAGNIAGIISPGLWAPAHQWSSHLTIPCEAPATRN